MKENNLLPVCVPKKTKKIIYIGTNDVRGGRFLNILPIKMMRKSIEKSKIKLI